MARDLESVHGRQRKSRHTADLELDEHLDTLATHGDRPYPRATLVSEHGQGRILARRQNPPRDRNAPATPHDRCSPRVGLRNGDVKTAFPRRESCAFQRSQPAS